MDKRVPAANRNLSAPTQKLGPWIIAAAVLHAILSPLFGSFLAERKANEARQQMDAAVQNLPRR